MLYYYHLVWKIIVIVKMDVEGERRRGRSKKRWLDTIENDMRAIGTCVKM
jgi:hypothetical protein